MRNIKIAALACLLVLSLVGLCQAESAADMVTTAANLARNNEYEDAIILLTKAIRTGDLGHENLVIAYRNRAAACFLLFKSSLEKGTKEENLEMRKKLAELCALSLVMAKKDAKKVLELQPGDEGAQLIITEVNKAVVTIGAKVEDLE